MQFQQHARGYSGFDLGWRAALVTRHAHCACDRNGAPPDTNLLNNMLQICTVIREFGGSSFVSAMLSRILASSVLRFEYTSVSCKPKTPSKIVYYHWGAIHPPLGTAVLEIEN